MTQTLSPGLFKNTFLRNRPPGDSAEASPRKAIGMPASPAWLDEWLESGAHLRRAGGGGLYDHEGRCPRVGDIWELLELLLAWWAERVCAVAAGFPVYREAEVEGGAEYGGGGGMRNLAGDVVAAAQAVESAQGLRKLEECLIPLSRVRKFIAVAGGPTPRDAVLLKALLIVHEGIAWATDRPIHRYYVEEIIPTARALYTSLPQDVLEGVDLEVGHTLPESMFAITGAVRPSWPRWGGNPSTLRRPLGQTSLAGGGGGGSGDAGSRTSNNGSSGGGGSANNGVESMDEWKEVAGFVPGPWVVFFVERQDYLDFYASQAEALEQVVGGYGTELEDMVC
eukprot:jgi/Undpi1/8273/HiC_scaffold_25.g10742.m1